MEAQGQSTDTKSWTSEDVPGQLVKSETRMTGATITMVAIKWEIK